MTTYALHPYERDAGSAFWRAAPWPRAALVCWALYVMAVLPWHPLTPIDETRYVGVAWEMWVRGDFVLPWLNGAPYAHKPPLLFWLIHAGWALFGVNAWWPLCVPALASGASLWLLHRIALRLWPERPPIAQLAPLLLFGCAMWALLSAAVMFDVLLVTFVLVGVLGMLDLAQGLTRRGSALFALAVGGGLLAKGPLAAINLLPVALAYPLWRRDLERSADGPFWGPLLLSGAAGCGVAGAWLAAAVGEGGMAYWHDLLFAQGFGRVVDSFDHRLPFWWYVPALSLVAFPWLWWIDGWRALVGLGRVRHEPGVRLSLVWALSAFVILSVISGKRAQYLFGLLPALALLWARVLEPRLEHAAGRLGAAPAALVLFAVSIALGLQPVWASHGFVLPWADGLPRALMLLPAGVGLVWLAMGRRVGDRLALLATGSVLVVAGAVITADRFTGQAFDVTPTARRIGDLVGRHVPVAVVGAYDGQFQFAARLREPLPVVTRSEAAAWLERHPDGRLVVHADRLSAPPPAEASMYRDGWLVLATADEWARLHPTRTPAADAAAPASAGRAP